MQEPPEIRHHATGHSRIDLIIGCLAVFLSMVSVWIALREGRSMERQVAAASWPNLSYSTGNSDGTTDKITLNIENTGVGPARIDDFELFYKDQPMANTRALANACCAAAKKTGNYSTNEILGVVLPARDTIMLLGLRRDQNPPQVWDILNTERFNIRVKMCYCSVFEECWSADSRSRRPTRVEECHPSQPIEFQP